ncbi:MAG TPA: chorismate mutase [Gemmatimonadaceae bacterium]
MALTDDELRAELARIRGDLDAIDQQLINLLSRRLEVGLEAANIKHLLRVPVHQPEREERAVRQAREWARAKGLVESQVEDIMRRMIELSRNAQLSART